MNNVFEPLRDLPEPPVTASAEMLATAQRSTRRRGAVRAAAGAVAVLAVLGGTTVAVDRFQPPPARQEAAAIPSPSAAPAGTQTPRAPAPEAVDKHSSAIARALITAVPSGYAAISVKLTGDDADPPVVYTVRVGITGGYRAITLVRVSAERGSGVLAAVFGTDLPSPGADADPCAANTDLGIEGAAVTSCWMTSVDGTPVRLVTGVDKGVGDVMSATRYLKGGYVVVTASQGMRSYRVSPHGDAWYWEVAVNPRHERALATMPFTVDALATLAMNPELIP